MEVKASRILYLLLFYSGWIGILGTIYAFCINAYNDTLNVITDNPSYFILFCVSLVSIAIADFMIGQTGRTKEASNAN